LKTTKLLHGGALESQQLQRCRRLKEQVEEFW
jgi:hypothetical protein